MRKSVTKSNNTKISAAGKTKSKNKLHVSFKATAPKNNAEGIVRVLHYQYQESDLQQFVF